MRRRERNRGQQGADRWVDCVLGFLLPALVGNTIGGVLLVALINHGLGIQSQK